MFSQQKILEKQEQLVANFSLQIDKNSPDFSVIFKSEVKGIDLASPMVKAFVDVFIEMQKHLKKQKIENTAKEIKKAIENKDKSFCEKILPIYLVENYWENIEQAPDYNFSTIFMSNKINWFEVAKYCKNITFEIDFDEHPNLQQIQQAYSLLTHNGFEACLHSIVDLENDGLSVTLYSLGTNMETPQTVIDEINQIFSPNNFKNYAETRQDGVSVWLWGCGWDSITKETVE